MPYILPNIGGLLDSQGNTLLNKGRVAYTATYNFTLGSYTQPKAPQLKLIAATYFAIDPWYDANGDPTPIDINNGVFDYEGAGIWLRKIVNGVVEQDFIYDTPQTGEDWNALVDICVPNLIIIDADVSIRYDADGTYRIEADTPATIGALEEDTILTAYTVLTD